MTNGQRSARIAIIGMGPRGLGALEALAARLQGLDRTVEVDAFDPFPAPGAGPNFSPDESRSCLLNIPIRDIAILPPTFSRCGGFAEWLDRAPDPDGFPPRAELGRYLEARHADLIASGLLQITCVAKRVERIAPDPAGWRLKVDGGWRGPYGEVLLTLGQPEVAPDDQLAAWQDHAARSAGLLAQAYPARRLAEAASVWGGKVVAVRGLGLSTFDVLRVLTVEQGGAFEDGRYLPSGREPARILPFSLDGKPPFAKPETEALDARFMPSAAETRVFADSFAKAAASEHETAKRLIDGALAPAVERILRAHGGDPADVGPWLATEWASPGAQETDGPIDTLRAGIALAEGSRAPTAGYAVGQVWRKWQDEIRAGYTPARTPADTAKALIGFDESLKRYSYGPPVASARELLALIGAGIVDPGLAVDPNIEMTGAGWTLRSKGREGDAAVMIDAVLPSPDLPAVTATLVSDLVAQGRLTTLTDGLGADTAADGGVIGKDGRVQPGLCLLGRLALGSVAAADSLHDCFGDASARWAAGVADRMD